MNLFDFFTDPVLRAPTLGSFFMCISSSLLGVVLFLKRKTLIAESLSHAAYPGVVIGVAFLGLFFPTFEKFSFLAVLLGSFLTSYLALKAILFFQKSGKMQPDSALCFALALFFGFGIVLASAMQTFLPSWNVQVQTVLFGQAATMADVHILLYAALGLAAAFFFWVAFYPVQGMIFDRDFSECIGIRVSILEKIIFSLLLLSLILGMRSVGLILMSGMVIAPAIAARSFTNRLPQMFALAAVFGAFSGLLGNILSVVGSIAISSDQETMTLPTGPMIVLVGVLFALLSLVFAPERGFLFRKLRIKRFQRRCIEENILKGIWKKGSLSKEAMKTRFGVSPLLLFLVARRLLREGWLAKEKGKYLLTEDGMQKAASIVRLHRLWELYLANMLKLESEKIHKTAEEMEHILTPDIEERLTHLLSNPTKDPHEQPIPQKPGAI